MSLQSPRGHPFFSLLSQETSGARACFWPKSSMGLAAFHCRQSPQNTGSQIKCKKPMFLSAPPLSQGHRNKRTSGQKGALGRDAATLGEGKEAEEVLGEDGMRS